MTDQKRKIDTSNALDPTGFLPVDFDIPVSEVPGRFVVRPLSMDLLIYDYQCLMLSKEHLATSGDIWPPGEFDFPPADFTLRQLLALLGELEVAMSQGNRVEYSVMNPEKTEEIAVIYILPSPKIGFDAMVNMFVRGDLFETTDLDSEIYEFAHQWIPEVYPFNPERIAYPGRAISWDEWAALPDL